MKNRVTTKKYIFKFFKNLNKYEKQLLGVHDYMSLKFWHPPPSFYFLGRGVGVRFRASWSCLCFIGGGGDLSQGGRPPC